MSRFSQDQPSGGFRLASPVKRPVASETPRCAPPHTFRAGEEPEVGGNLRIDTQVVEMVRSFNPTETIACLQSVLPKLAQLPFSHGILDRAHDRGEEIADDPTFIGGDVDCRRHARTQ